MSAAVSTTSGKGTARRKAQRTPGGDHDGQPRLQGAAADTQHGVDNDGEHGSLQAEEQAGDEADIAPDA